LTKFNYFVFVFLALGINPLVSLVPLPRLRLIYRYLIFRTLTLAA
jgi:hypothetical protein